VSTAVYCAPVMAPAAAPALGVTPAAVGYFVTVVYLGSMVGTVTAGGWVGRFGPIRVSQAGLLGLGMGLTAAAALRAAPDWPLWALFAFAMAFGATAVGWNGVFLAEIARLAPRDRISDATGGSAFFTFLGVVLTPPLFHLVLSATGSYGATYAIFGLPALAAGLRLLMTAKIARDGTHS
jgi:MFS family permease